MITNTLLAWMSQQTTGLKDLLLWGKNQVSFIFQVSGKSKIRDTSGPNALLAIYSEQGTTITLSTRTIWTFLETALLRN